MACTALAPELARHDLMPCSYLRLYCAVHGEIRVAAVEDEPSSYKCPVCGIECDCTLLARGGTYKPLPFHGVIYPPLRTSSGVALMSEEPYFPPLRTHVLRWPR